MAENLSAKGVASSLALTVLVFVDLLGYLWHGLLGNPSIMEILYPGFWSRLDLMLYGLVGTVVYAYVIGYFFAIAYNKMKG
jgi:hypothetical protein